MEEKDWAGDERTETRRYQVVALQLPSARPYLQVGPRGLISKISRWVGMPSLNTGDLAFDDVFEVHTDEAAFVGRVLTDDVRGWLIDDQRARDTVLTVQGDEVLTWREGGLGLADMQAKVDFLADLLDKVPDQALA